MVEMNLNLEDYIKKDSQGIFDYLISPIFYEIKNIPVESQYVVSNKETIDIIAKNSLGSESYWWVLGLYNDIIDLFNPLNQYKVLNIPDKVELIKTLNRCKLNKKEEVDIEEVFI